MGKNIFWSLVLICTFFSLWGIELSKEIDTTQLIRFHILAHSDAAHDQALKLTVKNEIISYMQEEFGQIGEVALGRETLLKNWDNIEATANDALAKQGYNYPIRLEYGYFPFPVKYYGNFSLPAGTYEAFRVVIGDGEGSNWWCVLFPPMCFTDSNSSESQYSENAPTEKIIFKWRFAEWWDKLTANSDDSDTSADSL